MIYCPGCGTANRDGSRFCNECGEKLGTQTRLKCPQCGTLNPVQNVFCSNCGGRLLSSPSTASSAEAPRAIKGLSLPTIPTMGEDEEIEPEPVEPILEGDMTPWLQKLGATSPSEPTGGEPDEPASAGEIPDWLKDLQASLPEEPEAETPPTGEQEADQTLDWLAGLGPAEPIEEFQPEIEEADVPDWLSSLRPTTLVEDLEPDIEEGDVPDWLAEIKTTRPAQEPEPEIGEDEIPDWLAALGRAEPEEESEPEIEKDQVPDWLAGPAPAEPVELLGPEIEDEDVPDWLASLGHAEPEEEPEPQIEEDEVPDWLASLGHAEPEDEPEAEIEEGEIPDWLAEIGATQSVQEPESEEDEIPGWPADLGPAEPVEQLESEIEEVEAPEWLAETEAIQPAQETEPEIEQDEVPEWLAALGPTQPKGDAETQVPTAEEGDTPDRLSEPEREAEESAPSEVADVVVATGLAAAGGVIAAEIPDWLADLKPGPEPEAGPREEAPETAAIPEWLATMKPAAQEEDSSIEEALAEAELPEWLVPAVAEGADASLERAEIPEWLLALKPRELREEEDVEAEAPVPAIEKGVEETGLLAGLAGTLPVEMLIAQPRTTGIPVVEKVPETDSPKARLFADIVARPPSVAPKAVALAQPLVLKRLPRLLIYLALIIAVVLPLLVGESLVPRTIEVDQAVLELHRAIDALPSNAPVLIAFDYDPATSGEMDVIARSITSHLASREARLVAFSLLPAGPAVAQSILEDTATSTQFANLGYLPGQATAVRLLGRSVGTATPHDYQGIPLASLPVMEGIATLKDFALVVELAASQNSLRWWVEQASAPYAVPLVAGVSASVDPLARPYYETEPPQLTGLVSGVPGAAMYDSLSSNQGSLSNELGARLDAQLAGHVVFVLVLLIGNGAFLFRRRTGEES